MAGVCGSSEAADNLRTALRMTMIKMRNEYMAVRQEISVLQQTCHDESFEVAKYMEIQLYGQLNKLFQEAAIIDRKLKEYSTFIEDLDMRLLRSASQCSYIQETKKGNGDFQATSQVWHKVSETKYVFDSPKQLSQMLDIQQGKSGLSGSCGICSVENVVRISGVKATEESVYKSAYVNALCTIQGGTTPESRKALLETYGIHSTLEKQSIENITAAVSSGRIVILSVDARKLYHLGGIQTRLHAIVATSVSVNEKGEVTEVTICDSNAFALRQSGAQTYSVKELERALTKRLMNVTEILR